MHKTEIGPLRLPSAAHVAAFTEMVNALADEGIEIAPDDMLLQAMTRYTQQVRAVLTKPRRPGAPPPN